MKKYAPTLIVLIAALLGFNRFINFVESRPGVQLPDPILSHITPHDFTWVIFALIYGSIGLAIYYLKRNPELFLIALQSYTAFLICRMGLMYLVPLDPPAEMIVLRDPIVELFGNSRVLTKDLFFSGHTGTVFLFFLVLHKQKISRVFLISTVLTGILLLFQHVHYSIDVVAAPFFSFACYHIVSRFHKA